MINNGDDNDVNDDVKAMMVEALAEWIDGDVRITRAEALFMYIAHHIHSLAACHPFRKAGFNASLLRDIPLVIVRCKTLVNNYFLS